MITGVILTLLLLQLGTSTTWTELRHRQWIPYMTFDPTTTLIEIQLTTGAASLQASSGDARVYIYLYNAANRWVGSIRINYSLSGGVITSSDVRLMGFLERSCYDYNVLQNKLALVTLDFTSRHVATVNHADTATFTGCTHAYQDWVSKRDTIRHVELYFSRYESSSSNVGANYRLTEKAGWKDVHRNEPIMGDFEGNYLHIKTKTAITSYNQVSISFLDENEIGLSYLIIQKPRFDMGMDCFNEPGVGHAGTAGGGNWTILKGSNIMLVWFNDELVTRYEYASGCKLMHTAYGIQFRASDKASVAYRLDTIYSNGGSRCPAYSLQNGRANPVTAVGIGQAVTITCDPGYQIIGSNTVSCGIDCHYDRQVICEDGYSTVTRCGKRDINPEQPQFGREIIGRRDASPGEYPWNVLIEVNGVYKCGGSIIYRSWVLTAAHCITKSPLNGDTGIWETTYFRANKVSIIAGVNSRSHDPDNTWQRRTAVYLHVHPNYQKRLRDGSLIPYNDVALILLNEPFDFNNRVNMVCLPEQNNLKHNQDLSVAGWGLTDSNDGSSTSDVLQKITVQLCEGSTLIDEQLCAGQEEGEMEVCDGYSGGPLVFQRSDSTFVQVGIVSWGPNDCTQKNYYANLAYFYDWIIDALSTLSSTSTTASPTT